MIHLFVKSEYSILHSSIKISELVKNAKEKGYFSLALCDTNTMYGTIEFIKECKKHRVKPIVGLDVSVNFGEYNGRFLVYAKDLTDYQNIVKLSSFVMQSQKREIESTDFFALVKDCVVVTHPNRSIFHEYLNNNSVDSIENFMIELKRNLHNLYVGTGIGFTGKVKIDNSIVEAISIKLGVKVVLANEANHLVKGDNIVVQLLNCIDNGTKLEESNDYRNNYLHDKDYFLGKIDSDIIANTKELDGMFNFDLNFDKAKLPKYKTPNGVSSKTLLQELCRKGLQKRLFSNVSPEYSSRLEHELNVITGMNFEDYFLITWDFIKYAKHNGIAVGPGRGSAAGSLVAYCLGITNVDPIKYGLLFERFLNPERVTMPDIDIDFQDTRRDEVIHYVFEKYGSSHVAHICTFQTLGAKSSLRDVGRVLGVSLPLVDAITKVVPGTPGVQLDETYKNSLSFKKLIHQNELTERMYNLALKIEGLPRQTGLHAAGIVISKGDLSDIVPVADSFSGINMTQYSMNYLEDLGLLKMDFLGLKNLTIISEIVDEIEKTTGTRININDIPLDDKKTFEIIAAADTSGIFQLESSGMRKVLKQMRSDCFDDIVATIALYRPGPMANIPNYIERKHGKEKITYIHESLTEILKPTHGIIVYQEQIMQIVQKVAQFSFGKADILRRAMGKKDLALMQKLEAEFINGAVENGYPNSKAKEIYDLIYKFADYGFNKSHSVAYALIGYQLSYLKANYPVEFMASLLSSVVGNENSISAYLLECKKYNIKILPPSINRSFSSFVVEDKSVRYSLISIKNFGQAAYKKIYDERKKNGPFKDFFDFIIRTKGKGISNSSIESLVWAGAFDEFGTTRERLAASITLVKEYADLVKISDDQMILDVELVPRPEYKHVKLSEIEVLENEFKSLGIYLSVHPLTQIKKNLKIKSPITDLINLGEFTQNIRTVVGKIVRVNKITTKKGDSMAFVKIADETGTISLTVFPTMYAECYKILRVGDIICAYGKVESDGDVSMILRGIKNVDELTGA